MSYEQFTLFEFVEDIQPSPTPPKMSELDELVSRFAKVYKNQVFGDYYNGDIEKFVTHQCNGWLGCYCSDYRYEFRPKAITFQRSKDSPQYVMTKNQFIERFERILMCTEVDHGQLYS